MEKKQWLYGNQGIECGLRSKGGGWCVALLFSCNGPSFKSSVQTYRDPKTVGLSPGCGYEEASELMSLTQDIGTSLVLSFSVSEENTAELYCHRCESCTKSFFCVITWSSIENAEVSTSCSINDLPCTSLLVLLLFSCFWLWVGVVFIMKWPLGVITSKF